MFEPTIEILILFGACVFSYYVWLTEKDRFELYYAWVYGAGVLALLWQTIASIFLHLSGSAQSINHYFLFTFWLAEALVWLSLTIKYYMRKRR